jgi:hypothetical protein
MTVQELIVQLQFLPPDVTVLIRSREFVALPAQSAQAQLGYVAPDGTVPPYSPLYEQGWQEYYEDDEGYTKTTYVVIG